MCGCALALLVAVAPATAPWETLEPGLELGEFLGPPSTIGDRHIVILRIDPSRFSLDLANASAQPAKDSLTARQWVDRTGAVAAINASMFRDDGKTSVSLQRTRAHTNNPTLSADQTVLAFDRRDATAPLAQLIDRSCQSWEKESARYGTLVQSIRMVSCDRRNVWSQSPKIWSTAAIGVDGHGRVLFIHARTPWSVHDLIDALLALPIDLRRAMYVEGGPEAQLFVRSKKRELEVIGSYETGFHESDDNRAAWPIPNVVVVTRRKTAERR